MYFIAIGCAYFFSFFSADTKSLFFSNSLTLVAALYYFIKHQLANAFKTTVCFRISGSRLSGRNKVLSTQSAAVSKRTFNTE